LVLNVHGQPDFLNVIRNLLLRVISTEIFIKTNTVCDQYNQTDLQLWEKCCTDARNLVPTCRIYFVLVELKRGAEHTTSVHLLISAKYLPFSKQKHS